MVLERCNGGASAAVLVSLVEERTGSSEGFCSHASPCRISRLCCSVSVSRAPSREMQPRLVVFSLSLCLSLSICLSSPPLPPPSLHRTNDDRRGMFGENADVLDLRERWVIAVDSGVGLLLPGAGGCGGCPPGLTERHWSAVLWPFGLLRRDAGGGGTPALGRIVWGRPPWLHGLIAAIGAAAVAIRTVSRTAVALDAVAL